MQMYQPPRHSHQQQLRVLGVLIELLEQITMPTSAAITERETSCNRG